METEATHHAVHSLLHGPSLDKYLTNATEISGSISIGRWG